MHTNPIDVIVNDKPIRASEQSALWCIDTIEQLWRSRALGIDPQERIEAERVFLWAVERYRQIAEDVRTMEAAKKKAL
jgi:hypothetical protein